MRTGNDKFRIHEGSYLFQILQKIADATKYSDSKSEEILSWKLELQMSEHSVKSEKIGNDLLVHPVFPIPIA